MVIQHFQELVCRGLVLRLHRRHVPPTVARLTMATTLVVVRAAAEESMRATCRMVVWEPAPFLRGQPLALAVPTSWLVALRPKEGNRPAVVRREVRQSIEALVRKRAVPRADVGQCVGVHGRQVRPG